jgi:DNA-binding NarL/FixJ family response regulator
MKKKRVVLVDDQVGIREMIVRLIIQERGPQFDYEVVGEAASGLEALEVCRKKLPDLVVLDLALPELSGSEVIRHLRLEQSQVRVLVYTGTKNELQIREALRSRPHGFVQKSDSLEVFREALRAVGVGGMYFTAFAAPLVEDARRGTDLDLTEREVAVLQLIAESNTTKEIACRLHLSTKTIETHRHRLMEKLHVHDVVGLTRHAIRRGLAE